MLNLECENEELKEIHQQEELKYTFNKCMSILPKLKYDNETSLHKRRFNTLIDNLLKIFKDPTIWENHPKSKKSKNGMELYRCITNLHKDKLFNHTSGDYKKLMIELKERLKKRLKDELESNT